jgi:hypothetical protein
MLREGGFPIDDVVSGSRIEPDILVEFRSAREITNRVERGEDVDPGDIGEAVHNFPRHLRAADRSAPRSVGARSVFARGSSRKYDSRYGDGASERAAGSFERRLRRGG